MQMISRPTRATATTSVRRMTGGNSLLLSGSGAPSRSRTSGSAGLVGGDFAADGFEDEGLPGDGLVGDAVEGLVGMTLTMVFPRRGDDTAQATSRTGLGPSPDVKRKVPGSEPTGCGGVCWSRASSDAHIQRGSPMTQFFDRRPSSRVASALVLASAVMLMPAAISSAANAQTLGYASSQPNGYPTDEVIASDESATPERLRRAVVAFGTTEAPGTIVIDTGNTTLYYVLGQGRAIRYGVGVGREGFTWSGVQTVSRKAEWPDWHPPAEMIARQPYLPRFMAGGPGNPLGARAMYLGNSVYRIHGTNDPSTIGKFVSSGCIRLTNEDVADLFSRVDVGAKVVVLPKHAPVMARGGDTRTHISVRPVGTPPRPVAATSSGRQAMNLAAPQLN
jgi:lipoprotein-anchoring transpeptidase ErfK/SrfK